MATAYLRTDCEHCQGTIEYPSELAGQNVPCPHCNASTSLPSPFRPAAPPPIPVTVSKRRGLSPVLIGATVLLAIVGLIALLTSSPNDSSEQKETPQLGTTKQAKAEPLHADQPTPKAPPERIQKAAKPIVAESYDLRLTSFVWGPSDSGRYAVCEGQVENISGASLKGVQAVVTFYTKDENFITSDSSYIEFQPVLNGQTSPFKTMTTYNPAMSKVSITFKKSLGGTLKVEYKVKE